jgi:CheY-like chemotaxis protein
LDSIEVIRKIREVDQGRQRHTPLIAMIAADQSEELASLKDTGMDDVLVKPVSTEQLAETMAQFVHLT